MFIVFATVLFFGWVFLSGTVVLFTVGSYESVPPILNSLDNYCMLAVPAVGGYLLARRFH
jgi:hypothetical protein